MVQQNGHMNRIDGNNKENRWFHSSTLLYDNGSQIEQSCEKGYTKAGIARQNNYVADIDDRRYGGYDVSVVSTIVEEVAW